MFDLQGVLKTSLLSLLSIVLTLAVVEGLARLCEPYVLHEENAKLYRIPVKGQDVFRVFVYGGSTVEGHPVPEFGFVPQMIFGLRKSHHGRQIEILNFGRSGNSSSQVVERLKATMYGKPDLVIVLTGHNEFLTPDVDGVYHSILSIMERNSSAVRVMKSGITAQLRKLEVSGESILPNKLATYDRRSGVFLKKVEKYSSNLKEAVMVSNDAGIPIILGTLPSNILNWPPVFRRIGKEHAYEERVESILASIEMNHLGEARAALSSFDDKNVSDPIILYLEGRLSHRMGEFEVGRQKLKEAKDSDPLPWRVLSIFNEMVRELEQEDKGIFVVDMERAFEDLSPGGVIGETLISDNCHPTPLGYSVMAIELINAMTDRLLSSDSNLIRLSPDNFLGEYLRVFTTSDTQKLWFRYYIENAKYAMKLPFFHYPAAMSFLEKASRIEACHLHVLLNKASLHLMRGDKAAGVQVLTVAKRIAGNSIDLDKRQHAPYLKEALIQSGVSLDDLPGDVVEGSECVG